MVHAWVPLVEEFVELNYVDRQGLDEFVRVLVQVVLLDYLGDHVV
jgi:hypothetical protein